MRVENLKRNKAACIISPLIGCILVGIVGTILLFVAGLLDGMFGLSGSKYDLFELARSTENAWLMGMMGTFSGMIIALFLFFLFYPFALAVWGPIMGRLPHQRVLSMRPYLIKGAGIGAVLCSLSAALMIHGWVGATESLNWEDAVVDGAVPFSTVPLTVSAALTGSIAGGIVGTLTAWVHYLILRPDRQFGPDYNPTVEVFD